MSKQDFDLTYKLAVEAAVRGLERLGFSDPFLLFKPPVERTVEPGNTRVTRVVLRFPEFQKKSEPGPSRVNFAVVHLVSSETDNRRYESGTVEIVKAQIPTISYLFPFRINYDTRGTPSLVMQREPVEGPISVHTAAIVRSKFTAITITLSDAAAQYVAKQQLEFTAPCEVEYRPFGSGPFDKFVVTQTGEINLPKKARIKIYQFKRGTRERDNSLPLETTSDNATLRQGTYAEIHMHDLPGVTVVEWPWPEKQVTKK